MERTNKRLWWIWVVVVLMLASCQSSASDAEELLQSRCSSCHSSHLVETQSQSRSQWESMIDLMIWRGADLDQEERDLLINYLAEKYP